MNETASPLSNFLIADKIVMSGSTRVSAVLPVD